MQEKTFDKIFCIHFIPHVKHNNVMHAKPSSGDINVKVMLPNQMPKKKVLTN